MIKPEQDRQQQRERNRKEDLSNTNVPEMHKPVAVRRGTERLARRQSLDVDVFHVAEMDKSSEEDERQWGAVIFYELSDMPLQEVTFS